MKLLVILNIILVEVSFAQHVVFPLHVGDRWHYHAYHGGGNYEAKIIGDTTLPNGKTYAIRHWAYSNTSYNEFVRQEQESVYVYYPGFFPGVDSELILYKFEWQSVDTTCFGSSSCAIATALWGGRLRVFHLAGIFGMGADIADSLGAVVNYDFDSYPDNLIGAVIDGVNYGLIDDVPDKKVTLPEAVHLWQNYPNPFNPATLISYSLSHTVWVNLSIFDLLGQRVKVLVNDLKGPGNYSTTWTPDANPTGVYFYILRAGLDTETKQMIYVK